MRLKCLNKLPRGLTWLLSFASICLAVCLFGSQSVSAVDAVLPVTAFQGDVLVNGGCNFITDTGDHIQNPCSFSSTNINWSGFDIRSVNVTEGWYYQFYFTVAIESPWAGSTPMIQLQPLASQNQNYSIVSVNQVSEQFSIGTVDTTLPRGQSFTYSVIVRSNETVNDGTIRIRGVIPGYIFKHLDPTHDYASATMTISPLHAFKLLDYSADLYYIRQSIDYLAQNSSVEGVIEQQEETNEKLEEQNERNRRIDEGLEDTRDQAQTDADSAQTDIDSQGTTLLQAFVDLVGAITNTSPTNCTINGNMGIGNFTLGTIDLCSLDVPVVFSIIGDIVLIGLVIPLSLSAYNKMVGLFRSFTK